jgi:two-component system chemotaxis sensor kinase CheA
MSEAEVHRLIFAPGFSTADTVTNLSGRGVGMDVVKSSVEKIGGQVDISSKAGQGSEIRIKIPLTLAIIPALLLSSGRQRFAVPQTAVIELLQMQSSEKSGALSWVGEYPFYKLREELLPLLFLSKILKVEDSESSVGQDQVIVVIDVDGCRFGVVVDTVHDTEEIVVKPLGRILGGLSAYAGATILGDGQIALILDPLELAHVARIEQQEAEVNDESVHDKETAIARCSEQLLIVQISDDLRGAVPLSQVRRLEEFSPKDVERVGGSAVIQYRGSILPLIDLRAAVGGAKETWKGGQVVVVGVGDASVGLQVQEILDVSDQLSAVKPVANKPGISSFGVVQGKVTAVLDVTFFIERGINASNSSSTQEQAAV